MGPSKHHIPIILLFLFAALVTPAALALASSHSDSAKQGEIYQELDTLGEVLEIVRADYVEKPDDSKLIKAAIEGLLTSLDPHSDYLDPDEFRDMRARDRGKFGGVGFSLTMRNRLVSVDSCTQDMPADKAGIRQGDFITAVDGKDVHDLTLEEVSARIRGPVNSPITLTIVRKGVDDPFDIKLVRAEIDINPVLYGAEDNVGYIRITIFNEQTTIKLEEAVKNLKEEIGPRLKGYIIDLRNNPGGLLDEAISVADEFLDQGAIVVTRGRELNQMQRSYAHPGDVTDGARMVLLINGGSASASEIVAGALQDHHRAIIVGTRSFGKGSVQKLIPLSNHGALKLTTARYYTPSGRSIQAKGIDPDKVVEEQLPDKNVNSAQAMLNEASLRGHLKGEGEDRYGKLEEGSGSSSYLNPEAAEDSQLQYALDLLRGRRLLDTEVRKAEGNRESHEQ
jgi:carboxyl-terminal processing protease